MTRGTTAGLAERLREFVLRLRALGRRHELERDLDDELRDHIERQTEANRAAGMSEPEARRAAVAAFGGMEIAKEEWGDVHGHVISDLMRDIGYGVRTLVRNPGFAAVAILTLAICIGANTAIFTVVNAVLVRPLPFPDPERLVNVAQLKLDQGDLTSVSPRVFDGWREHNNAFSDLGAWQHSTFVLGGEPSAERVLGSYVSPATLRALGVRPALGRVFTENEENAGSNHVIVLSHALWSRRYASDPHIVGRTVLVNDIPHTIVGVMPAGFQFPERAELWAPFRPGVTDPPWAVAIVPSRESRYRLNFFNAIARVKPGLTIADAEGRMRAAAAQMRAADPDLKTSVKLQPLKERVVWQARPMLLTLLGAVCLVLLIGCANVANLLFARGTARQKELAVRLALGARRTRLLRQLLTESLVLSGSAGLLGLALSQAGVKALLLLNHDLPRASEIAPDGRVLAFAAGISLFSGILFGCMPALRASALDLTASLKIGIAFANRERRVMRRLLVVGELALCVMLMSGAGLLIRSFLLLQSVEPGFRQDGVLSFQVSVPARDQSRTDTRANAFLTRVLERVRTIPGVRLAGATNERPFGNSRTSYSFEIQGRAAKAAPGRDYIADFRHASPDYFRAMGIPLLVGRAFAEADTQRAGVAVIDETVARTYWPGESPIGAHITAGAPAAPYEVIGVVGSVKDGTLREVSGGAIYVPWLTRPAADMYFALSTSVPPAGIVPPVRAAVAAVNPNQPVYGITTMREAVQESISGERFNTLLLAAFAGIGLLLAASGVYGLIAFLTEQRRQEMAVRIAVGAQPRDILLLVVGGGSKLTAAGIALGMVASAGATRLLRAALFGVGTFDAATMALVAAVMGACALLATYVPARRATRTDPITALRAE